MPSETLRGWAVSRATARTSAAFMSLQAVPIRNSTRLLLREDGRMVEHCGVLWVSGPPRGPPATVHRVSDYPTWSFRVPLRDDVDAATIRVLEAVARDAAPHAADLATLHPVVAYYLADWTRMLTGEVEPHVGPPVRLSGLGTRWPVLTIEFSQHDDEHANGGWIMWVWVLQLAARPTRGRSLIGLHGPSLPQNNDWKPIVIDEAAIDLHGIPWTWGDADEAWRYASDEPSFATWRP